MRDRRVLLVCDAQFARYPRLHLFSHEPEIPQAPFGHHLFFLDGHETLPLLGAEAREKVQSAMRLKLVVVLEVRC
jgi:hypothetical protein